VHTRQFGKLDRGAKEALKSARAAFGRYRTQGTAADGSDHNSKDDSEGGSDEDIDGGSDKSSEEGSDGGNDGGSDNGNDNSPQVSDTAQKPAFTSVVAGLACAVCEQAVTQPCWYCVQCEGPRIIRPLRILSDLEFP
jgi:hypothetical protein